MKPHVPIGALSRHLSAYRPLFRDRRLFDGFSALTHGILASGGLRLSQIARAAPRTTCTEHAERRLRRFVHNQNTRADLQPARLTRALTELGAKRLDRLTKPQIELRGLGMPKPLVSDELWALIHPLLPPEPPKPNGGRPSVPDRDALEGILDVLKTGTPWEHLPLALGYGSGMTCWRRLRDWHEAGVFTRLHHVLLDRMAQAEQLDWSRASLDSTSVPAARGARRPVRTQPIEDGQAANAM